MGSTRHTSQPTAARRSAGAGLRLSRDGCCRAASCRCRTGKVASMMRFLPPPSLLSSDVPRMCAAGLFLHTLPQPPPLPLPRVARLQLLIAAQQGRAQPVWRGPAGQQAGDQGHCRLAGSAHRGEGGLVAAVLLPTFFAGCTTAPFCLVRPGPAGSTPSSSCAAFQSCCNFPGVLSRSWTSV